MNATPRLPLPQSAFAGFGQDTASARRCCAISILRPIPAQSSWVSGPPGAGKTALVDVLRLFLEPSAGEAEILGVDVSKIGATARAKLKRDIGFMSESPVLADHLDAFENVSLPLRLAGAKASAYTADVEDLLKFLGVAETSGRVASALTGSEKRRVALARAVVGGRA